MREFVEPRLRAALFGALVAAASAATVFAAQPLHPAADVPISVVNGKPISLKQYRGKVVVVAMIETDCNQCIKSIDALNRVQMDFGPKGLQIVAAAGDNNAQYLLLPFIQRYRPLFPIGYLTTDQMIQLGHFTRNDHPYAPILIFIDRKGMVRQQVQGNEPFFSNLEAALRQQLQELLALKD